MQCALRVSGTYSNYNIIRAASAEETETYVQNNSTVHTQCLTQNDFTDDVYLSFLKRIEELFSVKLGAVCK